jgi:hypothetical protein
MIQSILSTFYMHAFISLDVIILLISTKKVKFMCNNMYIVKVVNMHVLVHKIVVQYGKINGEHYVI